MHTNALSFFIEQARSHWSGLNTNTVVNIKKLMKGLANTPSTELWLQELHSAQRESVELYRDSEYGFILLAHVEKRGRYRRPHNHGAGWVFYAVQHGQMEMASYGQVTDSTGETCIVSRGTQTLRQGHCNAYLPGDIHDTRCISDYALMFRLTSCDFSDEKRQGRLVQYQHSA